MAKKIGVIIDFLTDEYAKKINEAAASHGYEVEYFDSSRAAVGNVDDCEIIYGHPSQKVIASAKNLKWFACCWAGVDRFCRDELYQNPDCLLTNASGAYGTTIAEHITMVALMLLRRQMEYTEIIRSGGWSVLDGGIRSLHGARITVLGTGDIGTEFARRARAFHPEKLIGVRRSVRPNPDFDEIHAIGELDALLPGTDLLVMALPSTPDTEGNYYSVLPVGSTPYGAFTLKALVSGVQRTAVVPKEYMQWQPNHRYTYVFQIIDNSMTIVFVDMLEDDWIYGGYTQDEQYHW